MAAALVAGVKKQLKHTLSGRDKAPVLPTCRSDDSLGTLTDEQKVEAVIDEPKFGMFALFQYHVKFGYKNEQFQKRNRVYCSHLFSLWTALPVLIFCAQWLLYIGLVVHKIRTYKDGWCPNKAPYEQKVVMSGVAMLYFVRSFFLWDNVVDRASKHKVISSCITICDYMQEFSFNLVCYATNIYMVFTETDVTNMILDSMAMEFLMMLDNEFEQWYFKLIPGSAVDIYDKFFVETKKSKCQYICCLPYKLLLIALILFPFACFVMIFYGAICK